MENWGDIRNTKWVYEICKSSCSVLFTFYTKSWLFSEVGLWNHLPIRKKNPISCDLNQVACRTRSATSAFTVQAQQISPPHANLDTVMTRGRRSETEKNWRDSFQFGPAPVLFRFGQNMSKKKLVSGNFSAQLVFWDQSGAECSFLLGSEGSGIWKKALNECILHALFPSLKNVMDSVWNWLWLMNSSDGYVVLVVSSSLVHPVSV